MLSPAPEGLNTAFKGKTVQAMQCRVTARPLPGGCDSGVSLVGVAQGSPWGVSGASLGGEMEVLPDGEEHRMAVNLCL